MSKYATPTFTQPFERFVAVTPSDSTTFTPPFEALLIGVTGNVAITDMSDNPVTLTGLFAGGIYPIKGKRVLATGTTATGITACYFG